MKTVMHLGLKIRQARRSAGLSQKTLGDYIKVSDKAISSYEVGRAKPSVAQLQGISQATYMPMSFFIESDDIDDMSVDEHIMRIEKELMAVKRALAAAKERGREI